MKIEFARAFREDFFCSRFIVADQLNFPLIPIQILNDAVEKQSRELFSSLSTPELFQDVKIELKFKEKLQKGKIMLEAPFRR